MARIIPGVQVRVIKEVVPPQLSPSGVLGLAGLIAPPKEGQNRAQVERVSSWARFRQLYGRATANSMPEAQLALQNGVFELVVVGVDSATARSASATISFGNIDEWLVFSARSPGPHSNGLEVVISPQRFRGEIRSYECRIRDGDEDLEVYRNVTLFASESPSVRYLGKVLADGDSLLALTPPPFTYESYSSPATLRDPEDTTVVATLDGSEILRVTMGSDPGGPLRFYGTGGNLSVVRYPSGADPITLVEIPFDDPALIATVVDGLAQEGDMHVAVTNPDVSGDGTLSNGQDASVTDYQNALSLLQDVPDVDLVIASIQDHSVERAAQVYSAVISHCENMSADAKGRLGFGQVPPSGMSSMADEIDLVGSLISDRFVLFAPHGALGAAVGRIGSLSYYHSPTFKALSGLGASVTSVGTEAQRSYLRANIVPISEIQGRGTAIVRGLTTDGDQINVRRIADRAVRGVRQIGELFIGKLNTDNGRNALKQKLSEFLLQMESDNAIVPSTDGSDPAFKLTVHSSQADFAQGIVRVDLAIRPVRAIDYIYATVLVQV